MPRVALTESQRRKNKAADGNDALKRALNHFKLDNGLKWTDVALCLGVAPSSLSRWRDHPEIIPLSSMRQIAAVTKMSAEEWLKIGGF